MNLDNGKRLGLSRADWTSDLGISTGLVIEEVHVFPAWVERDIAHPHIGESDVVSDRCHFSIGDATEIIESAGSCHHNRHVLASRYAIGVTEHWNETDVVWADLVSTTDVDVRIDFVIVTIGPLDEHMNGLGACRTDKCDGSDHDGD